MYPDRLFYILITGKESGNIFKNLVLYQVNQQSGLINLQNDPTIKARCMKSKGASYSGCKEAFCGVPQILLCCIDFSYVQIDLLCILSPTKLIADEKWIELFNIDYPVYVAWYKSILLKLNVNSTIYLSFYQ